MTSVTFSFSFDKLHTLNVKYSKHQEKQRHEGQVVVSREFFNQSDMQIWFIVRKLLGGGTRRLSEKVLFETS